MEAEGGGARGRGRGGRGGGGVLADAEAAVLATRRTRAEAAVLADGRRCSRTAATALRNGGGGLENPAAPPLFL